MITLNELPEHVKKIALEYANVEHAKQIEKYPDFISGDEPLGCLFIWSNTIEGFQVWSAINNGNYTLFNNFHKTPPHDKTTETKA